MESIATPSSQSDPPSSPRKSEEILIQVEGLSKHFGAIRAIDGISFTARRGDILGFLGPNGAGKTTAMRMLTCFLEPDAGSIEVAGFDEPFECLLGADVAQQLLELLSHEHFLIRDLGD